MTEIIIATKNLGKAREFAELFADKNVKIQTLLDYPEIEDVEETGKTFEENAIMKAESMANLLGKLVIADDSGLIIDALNGEPGIFSARYAGEEKDDEKNIDKVLHELENVDNPNRTARFYCALAVAVPSEQTFTVHGTCEGTILRERKGNNGFGYDPIFYVKEKGKTMAELSSEEKNKISHRANALKKLAANFDSFIAL